MQATERRYSLLFLVGLFFLLFWSASDYGGRYLHVQTISQVLSAGLTLMLALQMLRNKDSSALLEYPLLKPVLLFLLVLGMCWIFSVNRLASLEETWRWVMYGLVSLGVYAWLRMMPDPEKKVRWVLTGAMLIGTGIVAAGFVLPSADSGLSSTFYRTNDLAGYLLLQVPLALHMLLISARLRARLGYGLIFGLLAGALVLTNSRSSWVAGLLACGLVLWFNREQLRHKALRWVLAGSGLILITGVAVFWQKVLPRLESLMHISGENATAWRLDLLKGTWRMFLAHPLLGSGPNTFASAFSSYQLQPGYFSINPHNFYLQALAETGVLGLIALLIWVGALGRSLLRRPNPYSVGVLGGLAASLMHIGFDIDWSVSAIPILFSVLLGAGLVSTRPTVLLAGDDRVEADVSAAFDARPVGILIFVSLALALIPSLNYFSARAYAESESTSDPAAAKAALQRAIALAPWPSGRHHFSFARQLLLEGKTEAALKEITLAIQLDVHNARYYTLAAEALLHLDRKPAALAMLLRCQELNPYRHPSIYTDIGDFYLNQQQEPQEALQWYTRGSKVFTTAALANYERYTPSDRYEAFNLLLKLAAVHEKLNQIPQSVAIRTQAQTLLHAAAKDMFVTSGYGTPVEAVMAYWHQVPEHYRDPGHEFDSLMPGSQVQAPPPQRLDADKIRFFQAERDLFNATLIYALPWVGQSNHLVLFEDHLVGDEKGWKIQARRSLN